MTKNLTRKGLALGAGLALVASGLAAVPAQATGIISNLSLAPNSVSTNYGVLLGQNFALKANAASSAANSGSFMKFLVEDSNANLAVVSGQYTIAPTTATNAVADAGAATLTLDADNHKFLDGDKVTIAGVTVVSTGTMGSVSTIDGDTSSKVIESLASTVSGNFSVGDTVSASNVSFAAATYGDVAYTIVAADITVDGVAATTAAVAAKVKAAILGVANALYITNGATASAIELKNVSATDYVNHTNVAYTITRANLAAGLTDVTIQGSVAGASGTITVPMSIKTSADISTSTYSSALLTISTTGNRAANNSFVVDTKSDTVGADKVLSLSTSSTVTKSANVTFWIDINDNDEIDSTEFQSPVRTVNWSLISDLAPTVVFSPVTTGDENLTATITTVPALNGDQVGDDKVGAVFIRQGSAVELSKLAAWNSTTKAWEVSVGLSDGSISNTVLFGTGTTGDWGFTNPTARTGTTSSLAGISSIGVSTTGLVSVIVSAAHNLRTGDKIEMIVDSSDSSVEIAEETTAATVTVTGALSFTYQISETVNLTTAASDTAIENDTDYTVETYSSNKGLVTRAFPGSYSAQFAAIPLADITGTTAQFLDKVATAVANGATVATASSLSVEAVESATAGKTGADTTDVLNGTTTASVVVTVLNSKGLAASGVSVKGTVASAPTSTSGFTLSGATAVNGSVAFVTTNALGQATFVVTNSVAAIGDSIALNFTTEGIAAVSETLTWNDAQYRIYDLNDMSTQSAGIRDRFALTGGTYVFDLLVADQYRNPAPAAFGLLATVTDRAVATGYVELSAGRTTYTVTDGGLGSGAFATVDLQIVKKVGAAWTTPTDADVVNWDQAYSAGVTTLVADEQRKVRVGFATQTDKITVNANGASSPNTASAGDLAATVATKALTEADIRLVSSAVPSYDAAAKGVVSGSVANSITGAANKGTVVTMTLPGILFNVGDVWKLNTISLLTDTNGFFAVNVYSGTSGSKKVAITSGNATADSATVVYTGISGDAVLTVTTPGAVKPASTFQVKAKLADSFGNPLDTAAGIMKVTYTGAGIVFGTLPTETDANGELMFSVLLGSNDTGTVSVTVSYDQNADKDFTDTKDLNVTSTTIINATGIAPASADTKVTVGTFSGYTAVFVKGYEGKKLSVKLAGKWSVVPSIVDSSAGYYLFKQNTGVGYTADVVVYIDGVEVKRETVVTK